MVSISDYLCACTCMSECISIITFIRNVNDSLVLSVIYFSSLIPFGLLCVGAEYHQAD